MKKKIIVISMLVFSLLLTTGAALASAPKTYVEGTECNSVYIAPGEARLLGNGKLRMTGLGINAVHSWNDPRLNGISTVDINFIVDPVSFTGPAWGYARIDNANGSWSGQWVGKFVNDSLTIQATYTGSGDYAGLVAKLYGTEEPDDVCVYVSGYILETGANK